MSQPPKPIELTLYCESFGICWTDRTVRLIGVEIHEVLEQIPAAEAVRQYGAHALLQQMDTKDIKDYLNPEL